MDERENWKHILKKVIQETETNKITTTDDVIKALIHELTGSKVNSLSEADMSHCF